MKMKINNLKGWLLKAGLFAVALLVLGASAGCAGRHDREEPGITFCAEAGVFGLEGGGQAFYDWVDIQLARTIAYTQEKFPALAEERLGRNARRTDCSDAELKIYAVPGVDAEGSCAKCFLYDGHGQGTAVGVTLGCLATEGENTFDEALTDAASQCLADIERGE
jgi:hypothetical protein